MLLKLTTITWYKKVDILPYLNAYFQHFLWSLILITSLIVKTNCSSGNNRFLTAYWGHPVGITASVSNMCAQSILSLCYTWYSVYIGRKDSSWQTCINSSRTIETGTSLRIKFTVLLLQSCNHSIIKTYINWSFLICVSAIIQYWAGTNRTNVHSLFHWWELWIMLKITCF